LANQGSVLAPLVPVSNDESGWVPISDAFPWSGRGIQFSRTWPVGPSKSVVERRWRTLLESPKKARGELLNESGDTKTSAGYRSFLTGGDLPPVTSLSKSATPDGYRQVGYRSFDTQWCVADRRVVDRPRPPLWAVAGDQQVFLVTLTGSAFGVGPQAFATPYVPDLNSFRGFGGGLAFPLWRDKAGTRPNITAGLLESLSSALGTTVEAEDLFAYTYGLLGTPAMSSWIASNPLAQVSPPSVPVTRDEELFREVASLGAGLIALHTNGMRFPGAAVDSAAASGPSEAVAVRAYPNDYSYNPDTQVLSVGEGRFGPVSEEVWSFEVSGLKVVQSWLGYRMAERRGRKSSALDDIAPGRWTFTPDLLRLLGVLERTVEMTPRATELLERVVTGGLIEASALPIPIEDERKAPSS
jgi:hypothetical protein